MSCLVSCLRWLSLQEEEEEEEKILAPVVWILLLHTQISLYSLLWKYLLAENGQLHSCPNTKFYADITLFSSSIPVNWWTHSLTKELFSALYHLLAGPSSSVTGGKNVVGGVACSSYLTGNKLQHYKLLLWEHHVLKGLRRYNFIK